MYTGAAAPPPKGGRATAAAAAANATLHRAPCRRAAGAASAGAAARSAVPASVDNAAAQAAAAIDVEYAHYERVWLDKDGRVQRQRSPKRRKGVSVPASVAVVARRPAAGLTPQGGSAEAGWRAGLDVLYHAPYIETSQEQLDRAAADAEVEERPGGEWRWVGGVRPPSSAAATTATTAAVALLDQARLGVLEALAGRSVVVLHGAARDLRALGLETMLLLPRDDARLVAAAVVDTSALPPLTNASSGAPVSLRRLARRFLERDIQSSASLHDPVEDAATALDLWLDVAWPRALVERQRRGPRRVEGADDGSRGAEEEEEEEDPERALVEALGATLAREMAQGRRSRMGGGGGS